ncbi:unnamed protein product [Closterium sp. NIES-64]|nr:unnamed protein product [Closterium sp. NIES-64]
MAERLLFGIGRGGRGRASSGRGRRGRGGGGVAGAGLGRGGRGVPPAGDCGGQGGAGSDFTGVGGGVRGVAARWGRRGSRGMPARDGPALQVEGGESRLVGLLEGRGVQEQDGPALEVEGGESRLVGLLEGRGVQEQDGPALEVEGGESRLVGLLEGRGVQEQDGPALEVEGGESRLVGLLEGRWVPEQDGPALEVEGGESRLVGLLEGRGGAGAGWSGIGGGGRGVPLGGVPEQDGPALEVEGGESRLVGLLEGRWGPEQDGQALEVEGEESRLVMLLEGEDAPEQDGQASGVRMGGSRCSALEQEIRAPASVSDNGLASCSTGDGIGALTTVGNPGARAFDVNTVLRRAREWYRAEDIDTGRTTGTQGSEMGGFTEHFHPASALALPWPDCGQRGGTFLRKGRTSQHVRMIRCQWMLGRMGMRRPMVRENPEYIWYERKEKARCRDEYLTAAASKRLDQKKQRCQGYWFIGGDNTVGTIQTRGGENEFQWRSFNVNLDARTCECGNWEEYQFPCAHAVAMCILKQRSVEILVSEYYTTRNLRQTYNRDVMGTCVDRLIMEAPLAEVGECDAPALIETRVGRPENHTRFEAPPHAYRCGRCRQYGHNRKRCKYKYGGYGQAQAAVGEEVEEEEEEEEEEGRMELLQESMEGGTKLPLNEWRVKLAFPCEYWAFRSPLSHRPSTLPPPFPLSHRLPLSRPFLSLVAFPLSRRLPLSCRLSSLSSPFLSRCPSSLPLPVLTPLPLLLPPPAALAFHHNRLLNALHPPCPPPIARTVARPVSPSNRTYHRMSRRSLFRSLFPFPRSLPPLPVALALSPPFPSPSLSPLPSCRPLSLPSLSVALALSPPFPPPSLSHLPFRRPRSLTSLSVALSPPFPSPSFSPLPFRRPRSLPSLSVALTLSSHSTNTQ